MNEEYLNYAIWRDEFIEKLDDMDINSVIKLLPRSSVDEKKIFTTIYRRSDRFTVTVSYLKKFGFDVIITHLVGTRITNQTPKK